MTKRNKTLVLFDYDWDRIEFKKLSPEWPQSRAGFDLFSFPSKLRLAWFDINRFSQLAVLRAKLQGVKAVVSNHEQYGALCTALVAEKLGLPGTSVEAVLACQHKLYARAILERVAPEANIPYSRLNATYGSSIPEGINYPIFVKPVKAAFSVLAKNIENHQALHEHTRFSRQELWTIRHLVEPFEKILMKRIPSAGTAHSLILEEYIPGQQHCLDGYYFDGNIHRMGVVDAHMYPGTDAFMRWDYPSQLSDEVQLKAEIVADKFLKAVGFTHGFFNMEFVIDEQNNQIKVIEFNPRMAAQFSDLYERVNGVNLHEMAIALAHGLDPATLPMKKPTATHASSVVYRSFDPNTSVSMPTASQQKAFNNAFPDGLLIRFPKRSSQLQQDFKWLGSYRFGIVHLGGNSLKDLRQRCEHASSLLGWSAQHVGETSNQEELADCPDVWPSSMETENTMP